MHNKYFVFSITPYTCAHVTILSYEQAQFLPPASNHPSRSQKVELVLILRHFSRCHLHMWIQTQRRRHTFRLVHCACRVHNSRSKRRDCRQRRGTVISTRNSGGGRGGTRGHRACRGYCRIHQMESRRSDRGDNEPSDSTSQQSCHRLLAR